jgi:putative tricarboxylic transport membrane protein
MEMFVSSLTEASLYLSRPEVLLFIAVGVIWGSICGALPGVGSGVGIGVMVPLTYTLDPVTAVAFSSRSASRTPSATACRQPSSAFPAAPPAC